MSWAFETCFKSYDNRSDRQIDIVEIVYDFSMTRAARATKIACDNRKQKSYRVNRPLNLLFWDVLLPSSSMLLKLSNKLKLNYLISSGLLALDCRVGLSAWDVLTGRAMICQCTRKQLVNDWSLKLISRNLYPCFFSLIRKETSFLGESAEALRSSLL